jgi:hypothetical protein
MYIIYACVCVFEYLFACVCVHVPRKSSCGGEGWASLWTTVWCASGHSRYPQRDGATLTLTCTRKHIHAGSKMSPGSEHTHELEHLCNSTISFTYADQLMRPPTTGVLTTSADPAGPAYGYRETPSSSIVRSPQAAPRTDSPEPLVEFAGVFVCEYTHTRTRARAHTHTHKHI